MARVIRRTWISRSGREVKNNVWSFEVEHDQAQESGPGC